MHIMAPALEQLQSGLVSAFMYPFLLSRFFDSGQACSKKGSVQAN